MAYSCKLHILVLTCLTLSSHGSHISPAESQYDIILEIQSTNTCSKEGLNRFCSNLLPVLSYEQCTLSTKNCAKIIVLRISYSTHTNTDTIENKLKSFKSQDGMSIIGFKVADVNECIERIDKCSINGACTNTPGTYECHCGFGYKEIADYSILPGTFCVARCNRRSCRNGGTCTDAADEVSEVRCDCGDGYTGDTCQQVDKTNALPYWSIVFISVITAIAAVVGITLCVYTCFRLFYKKPTTDDITDDNSIVSYKPRAIPGVEYDRITDIGSFSRGNRGFASTIDEESEEHSGMPSVKNDGLKFGSRLMSSRLSIPSEHGDPTPTLNPYTQTDRHAASNMVSQPDYY